MIYNWSATSVDGGLTYAVTSSATAGPADADASRTITARVLQNPRFRHAAFADVFLEMGSSNNDARSYDSRDLSLGTRDDGVVGTNGSLDISSQADYGGVVVYDADNATKNAADPGRLCTASEPKCTNVPTPMPLPYDFIQRTLASPACPSTPVEFKASTYNGVIPAGIYCATDVNFDRSTVTLASDVSPSNPVIIYATGVIKSGDSTDINMVKKSAASLQIYTTTSGDIAFGNHGNIAAALYVLLAGCPKATNAQTAYWGSLICRTIDTNGGWNVNYDRALGTLGDGVYVIKDFARGRLGDRLCALGLPVLFLLTGLVAVLGLLIGSFLNVVIWRVPRGESVVQPAERLPALRRRRSGRGTTCRSLSWLLLRGRCRDCGNPISARYPLVEAATGALFAVTAWHFGLDPELPAYLYLVAVGRGPGADRLRHPAPAGRAHPSVVRRGAGAVGCCGGRRRDVGRAAAGGDLRGRSPSRFYFAVWFAYPAGHGLRRRQAVRGARPLPGLDLATACSPAGCSWASCSAAWSSIGLVLFKDGWPQDQGPVRALHAGWGSAWRSWSARSWSTLTSSVTLG